MQTVRHAGSTSSAGDAVTKVVSADNALRWVSPAENSEFKITEDGEFPEIVFEFRAQAVADCTWSWAIEWDAKVSGLRERARQGNALQTFKASGSFNNRNNVCGECGECGEWGRIYFSHFRADSEWGPAK
jgi:hypothetical protein